MNCYAVTSSSINSTRHWTERSINLIASPSGPHLLHASPPSPRRGRRVTVRAGDSGNFDAEAIVRKYQDKFEQAENKPVVIGYGVGALIALFITEWIIHLPGLDVIFGFPIQLVGVLMLPLLLIRYLVDGQDITKDTDSTLDKVTSLLPGLKK